MWMYLLVGSFISPHLISPTLPPQLAPKRPLGLHHRPPTQASSQASTNASPSPPGMMVKGAATRPPPPHGLQCSCPCCQWPLLVCSVPVTQERQVSWGRASGFVGRAGGKLARACNHTSLCPPTPAALGGPAAAHQGGCASRSAPHDPHNLLWPAASTHTPGGEGGCPSSGRPARAAPATASRRRVVAAAMDRRIWLSA